jgi:omega-6 fatty acid desaturase (delta-12 desaturase)
VVARYDRPDRAMSILTLADSVIPYLILYCLMYRFLAVSPWITLALSLPAAGFLVRIFIVFHDCGHGSFFASRKTCNIVGRILGVLIFTPYDKWTREHAVHHVTVGDLDRRGTGDVWTQTKTEYLLSPLRARFFYRLYRNPFFLFGVGAFFLFLILHRFHGKLKDRRELISIYGTDLALAAIMTLLAFAVGIRALLLIQLPILYVSAVAGVWLFYVQHQFEGVYWCRNPEWEYATVALQASSFYRLPRVLQWFTGNIGYHHVHHLSPRIPSYRLPACHRENVLFEASTAISLWASARSLRLSLWDEKEHRLTGFGGHHWYRGPS